VDSTVLDWVYENEMRAYPLKEAINRISGAYTLTDNVILDAQFIVDSEVDTIELIRVVVSGNTVTFRVTGNIDLSADKSLSFPQYLRTNDVLLVIGEGAKNIPDGTNNFSSVTFEPTTIFEYYGPWLGVESLTFDGADTIAGDITLFEGYQFDIRVDGQDLGLAAGSMYGEQINCTHFGDEVNDCEDIISFINGVSPDGNNRFNILAGNGINVWDDPENHRIYVGFAFTSGDDVCKDIPPFPIV
jgi:hypothetical protein